MNDPKQIHDTSPQPSEASGQETEVLNFFDYYHNTTSDNIINFIIPFTNNTKKLIEDILRDD